MRGFYPGPRILLLALQKQGYRHHFVTVSIPLCLAFKRALAVS